MGTRCYHCLLIVYRVHSRDWGWGKVKCGGNLWFAGRLTYGYERGGGGARVLHAYLLLVPHSGELVRGSAMLGAKRRALGNLWYHSSFFLVLLTVTCSFTVKCEGRVRSRSRSSAVTCEMLPRASGVFLRLRYAGVLTGVCCAGCACSWVLLLSSLVVGSCMGRVKGGACLLGMGSCCVVWCGDG